VIAAPAQRHRRLQPGRAGARDQHLDIALAGPDPLRMPAAPPLLAHAWVLRAADRGHGGIARDADVAADALADVLQAALLDLLGQERVGDRRPRGADEV